MAPKPTRRRRPRRLLLLLVLPLLGAGALEGAVRVRQWLRYGMAGGSLYEFDEHPGSGLRIPRPGVVRGADVVIDINREGFRSPELQLPKPAGRVRLAFLGGSTTFCAEASSNAATWPHLVRERLALRFPEAEIDYVNAGAGGFAVSHSRRNLEHRVAAIEPDVIVVYHATNDLAGGTRELAVEQGVIDPDAGRRSWLAEWSLAWQLVEKNFAITDDPRLKTFRDDVPRHAAIFREQLLGLVGEAQATVPLVVLVTFAHKARREQDDKARRAACVTSLYWMPYMTVDGIVAGIEAYNDVIRDVARQTGALLVEGEHTIPGEDLYFRDSVHLTDEGCQLQADRLVETLVISERFTDMLRVGR